MKLITQLMLLEGALHTKKIATEVSEKDITFFRYDTIFPQRVLTNCSLEQRLRLHWENPAPRYKSYCNLSFKLGWVELRDRQPFVDLVLLSHSVLWDQPHMQGQVWYDKKTKSS